MSVIYLNHVSKDFSRWCDQRPMLVPPDTRVTHAKAPRRAAARLATNGQVPVLSVCLPAPR